LIHFYKRSRPGMDEVVQQDGDRSLAEVSTMISHAKLVESDLLPLSQVVTFAENLQGENVKLVEVPKDIADGFLAGESLVIRGEESDNSVVCSQSKTYEIKEAETSNSLLMCPHLRFPDSLAREGSQGRQLAWTTVTGLTFKYFELQEIRPKTRKLREILMENPYSEDSARNNHYGPTFQELLNRVQASESELRTALIELQCIELDYMWYILDQDYQMKVLSMILRFFEENSWSLDRVQKAETVTELSNLAPAELLGQLFDIYCMPQEGGEWYKLHREKVSRFFGDFLLAVNSGYVLSEFLEMWQKAVPDGIVTDISHLAGLVLLDEDKVRRFSEADLPAGVADRLVALFAARERWTLTEITPFIAPLTTNKLNVNALLTKYARPLNLGGVKYFCAKHGK